MDGKTPIELSKCCNEPVHVESSEEGTNCYICNKCEEACDIAENSSNVSENNLELDNKNVLDNSNDKSSWGGPRPGAGRPVGALSKTTIEQKIAKQLLVQRVLRSQDRLINAQMSLAQGCSFLYVIKVETVNGIKRKERPQLVKDQYLIESYLAGDLEDDEDYYFITTEKPDTRALDSLLDRVHGKANQSVDLTTKGKKINFYSDEQRSEIAKRILSRDISGGRE